MELMKEIKILAEQTAYNNKEDLLLEAGRAKSIDQIGEMRAVLERVEGVLHEVMPELPAGTIEVHKEVREALDRREAELKTIGGTV